MRRKIMTVTAGLFLALFVFSLSAVAIPAVMPGVGVEDVQAGKKITRTKGKCMKVDFNGDGVITADDATFYSQNIGPLTIPLLSQIYACLGQEV